MDELVDRFRGSDPVAGARALQGLLSLGDQGEDLLFAEGIYFRIAQVRRRWLRYVALRGQSISQRLLERMRGEDRFDDGHNVAFLFAGLSRQNAILTDLSAQISQAFPGGSPSSDLYRDYTPTSNRILAWGYAGGDSGALWHRVKDDDFAWEKLRVFALRASCAAFARTSARDNWSVEQLITHYNDGLHVVPFPGEPEDPVPTRALDQAELWQQSFESFAIWRRGEVADRILTSWAEHPHWRVRDFGAQVLGSLGFQRTVNPIRAWLETEPDSRVRSSLLFALGQSNTTSAADILVDYFITKRDGATPVTKVAHLASDPQRAISVLRDISAGKDNAGSEAVVGLARLGYIPSDLLVRLESTDSYRRLNAALALAYLRDTSAIARLRTMRREAATPFERVLLSAGLALLKAPNAAAELNRELITSAELSEPFDIFIVHGYHQQAILDGLEADGSSDVSEAWRSEIEPFETNEQPVRRPSNGQPADEAKAEIKPAQKESIEVVEEIPIAVILTALEVETRAVLRHLGKYDEDVVSGTVFRKARLGTWMIAVAEVGAGNSGAAAIAERAFQRFKPSVALFVGVAGGIKDVGIGDVVVATKVYGYESGKETDDGFLTRPEVFVSAHALEQRARALRLKDDWRKRLNPALGHNAPDVFVGPIAAGEKVVAATKGATAAMLRRSYGDALAVEMEGKGFLGSVHLNPDVKASVIRGISDVLDKKAEADAGGSQDRAADSASAVAIELLLTLAPPSNGGARIQSEGATDSALNGGSQVAPEPRADPRPAETSRPEPARGHVVILVHGIRDFALWQVNVEQSLDSAGFKVASTNYGRFNLIEFLLPFSYFRNRAIKEIWNQIRIIRQNNKDALISVIAHSFGTYVVAKLMQQNFDIEFHRVIFCGSVVQYKFPFENFQNRFHAPILNEVGARDIWPAMAESLTTGYGSAGTYGFRRALVKDRWHSGAQHGYFLNDEFCKKYWIPWLKDDEFVPGASKPESPRVWVQIASIVKIKYVIALVAIGCLASLARCSLPGDAPYAYSQSVSASRPFTDLGAAVSAAVSDLEANCRRGPIGRWLGRQVCVPVQMGGQVTALRACNGFNVRVATPEAGLRSFAARFGNCLALEDDNTSLSVSVRPEALTKFTDRRGTWFMCGCTREQIEQLPQ